MSQPGDKLLGTQTHELKYHAVSHIIALSVGTGIEVIPNTPMLRLQDKSGALVLTCPQAMIPWAKVGDVVLFNFSCVNGEIVSTSNILRPSNAASN